jgi:formylglycine-generating enzyme required for sulfatase activity
MAETFTIESWKAQTAAWWCQAARDLPGAMKRLGVRTAYGLLTASAFAPLVAAYGDDPGKAAAALVGIAGGVGTNLLSNLLQGKYDKTNAPRQAEQEIAERPELRPEYQQLLNSLDVLAAAQATLGNQWAGFEKQLREEVSRMGGSLRIETGGGAVVFGNVNMGGGAFIGRDQVIVQPGGIHAPGATFVQTGDKDKDRAALERRYLEWVFAKSAPLQLRGIDPRAISAGRGEALALWAVYVSLDTEWKIPKNDSVQDSLSRGRQPDPREKADLREREELRSVAALEVTAAAPYVVLTGAPGSGKSTFVSYLTLCLAGARLGEAHWLDVLQPAWTYGARLPMRITLRDFAARAIPADARKGRAQMLWEYVSLDLQEAGLGAFALHLQTLAGNEGIVFMLDGLDEVPEGARRDRVREAVDELAATCGQNSRFIVTARPYAYDDPNRRLPRFAGPFALAPFDDAHIQQFIGDWYRAVEKAGWVSAREAQDKSIGLTAAAQRVDLRPIAERPLLLTLMATLHTSRGKLPDDRADLYNDIVELLLWHWNESKGEEKGLLDALDVPGLKLPDLRRKIEQVAFEAHEAQGHQAGPADIACDDIIRIFRPLLGGSRDKAALVIEYIEKRAGLLSGLGEKGGCDRYAFPHRTFQEYLAGCYLAGRDDFRLQAPAKVQAAPAQWREVFILGARHARADRGIPAADALIQSLPIQDHVRQHGRPIENQWRSALVAGLALLEIGQAAITADPSGQAVRARVAGWLLALIQTPRLLPLADRIEAGSTLGRLGDPRFVMCQAKDGTPYVLPQPVRVEAGPFEMGSNQGEPGSDNDEYSEATRNKRHVVTLPEFWIEPYPVTNAEYRYFVQAAGHEAPEHWRDGNVPPGLETHPVVNVSWRDALAYCTWLSQVAGLSVRLPTEAEWEKAARWDAKKKQARVYPWGDEWDAARCNTREAGLGTTTPVGMYPDGISPYDCLDMAGNVWEWTQSKFTPYPYNPKDGRNDPGGGDSRVVRGGAWGSNRDFARCAYRVHDYPDFRGGDGGFRVMVSPGSRS